GVSFVGNALPTTACCGPGDWPVPYEEAGSGTNWSWPVWPTSFRIAAVSLMPGTSTMIRSVPDVTTTGSDTPVELTRRSMICLTTQTSARVGVLPFEG